MSIIHVLPPHIADLIAAGEVVDRPASVVKELLENSIDAGAKNITIEIHGGGREAIRITDDGCGMTPEDAGVCFTRHATSKLSDARGLEAIGTFGFRGEALAAIGAVSRITLTTRPKGAEAGIRIELEGGEILQVEECGCPEGTTLVVRDLFYNTPARQKFLGSDRAEGSACVQAALRSALGCPSVSFRCVKDEQEEFFAPGDGNARSAIYTLLGREFQQGLLEVSTEQNGVSLTGFVSAPGYCRGNRSGQYFYCNNRPIRSRTLQAALEQAYRNATMIGKFPACVLYLTIPNASVDVNVHPTKAEVKFAHEKEVFDAVYYGTLSAIQKKPETPKASPTIIKPIVSAPTPIEGTPEPVQESFFKAAPVFRAPVVPYTIRAEEPEEKAPIAKPEDPTKPVEAPSEAPVTPTEPTIRPEPTQEIPSYRYIGELMHVYILLEQADQLLLIDKHAAHERILFDKMRLNEAPLMSQDLLVSETFTTDGEGADILQQNQELLQHLGFQLEAFGDTSFIIRSVPADIEPSGITALLEELVEKLKENRSLTAADVRERMAATIACKAAIKAGWISETEELLPLVEKVLSGEIQTCPHGRPVLTRISRQELDRRFGRIV